MDLEFIETCVVNAWPPSPSTKRWAAILGVSCAPAATTDPFGGRPDGDLIPTELMLAPEGTDTGSGSGSKTHVIRAGTLHGLNNVAWP